MSRWIVPAVGFVAVSFVAGAPTRAEIVYFYAEGVVTRVRDPEGLLPPNIVPGSTFWAEYSVQTLTPDQDFLDPVQGFYPNAMWDLYGEVAGHDFELYALGGDVRIENPLANSGGETYSAWANSYLGAPAQLPLRFAISLLSSHYDVLPDDSLPSAPLPLDAFEFARLTLSDPTELIPVSISADLTEFAIIPEPATGLLLGVLLITCAGRRRRWHHYIGGENATRTSLIAIVTLNVMFDCHPAARAQDCGNITACQVDVVFLFDTSTSMGGPPFHPMSQLCSSEPAQLDSIPNAVTDLLDDAVGTRVDLAVEKLVLSIASEEVTCVCCDTTDRNVPVRYGTTATGYPDVETLGDICNPSGVQEDWGPAVAIVAANKANSAYPWRPGAKRFIVPISDEGPRCGSEPPFGEIDALDRAAIDHAIPPTRDNDAIVVPIMIAEVNDSSTNELIREAPRLAANSAPGGMVLFKESEDIATRLADMIRRACPSLDCDGNGIRDSCDITQGAADCQGSGVLDVCETQSGVWQ